MTPTQPETVDLAELRRLAEAASPGPWTDSSGTVSRDRTHQCSVEAGHEALGMLASVGWVIADIPDPWQRGVNGPPTVQYQAGNNARYIAAANPTVVPALLSRIEALETALKMQSRTMLARAARKYLAVVNERYHGRATWGDVATADADLQEILDADLDSPR